MFKKLFLIVMILLISLFLITVFVISPISRKRFQEYDSFKKKSPVYFYYYSDSNNIIREGLYITNLRDVDSLLNYYKLLDKGIEPKVRFASDLIEINDSVYIIQYVGDDSLIAEIIYDDSVSFNNRVYIYTPLLHNIK